MPNHRTDKEAPWMVLVEYPLQPGAAPDHDGDLPFDKAAGQNSVLYCTYGDDFPRASPPVRRLRYAFWELPHAMAAARRMEALPDVLRLDVFDAKYPCG